MCFSQNHVLGNFPLKLSSRGEKFEGGACKVGGILPFLQIGGEVFQEKVFPTLQKSPLRFVLSRKNCSLFGAKIFRKMFHTVLLRVRNVGTVWKRKTDQ